MGKRTKQEKNEGNIVMSSEEKISSSDKRRWRRNVFMSFCSKVAIAAIIAVVLTDSGNAVIKQYETSNKQTESVTTEQNPFVAETNEDKSDFKNLSGEGTFEFSTGATYKGFWENGFMNGPGLLNIPNEGTYEGDFLLSERNGHGVFTWNDGAIYTGEWVRDKMEGSGTYISSNYVKYEGLFQNNRFKSGNCTFSNKTGSYVLSYDNYEIANLKVDFLNEIRYEGETDGKSISGTGVMQFANGDRYTGSYADGVRSGQGIYVWHNGDIYDGEWSDDNMTGIGCYTYTNGNYVKGTFKNNQFEDGVYSITAATGKYDFIFENRKNISVEISLVNGMTYLGDLINGKLTGKAKITYDNGDTYEGEVVNAFKSGYGLYRWASGAYYSGNWTNDKMNGHGSYFYPDTEKGFKLVGNFEEGVPEGSCLYYVDKEKSYKTDWINGKCVKTYE